jgi:hypothetical protein
MAKRDAITQPILNMFLLFILLSQHGFKSGADTVTFRGSIDYLDFKK